MNGLRKGMMIYPLFFQISVTSVAFFLFFGLALSIEPTSLLSCPERHLTLFTGLEALHVFLRANVKKDCKLPRKKNQM
jgi:hypothetical protein